MIEIKSFRSYFEGAKPDAEILGEFLGATPAQTNAEAAVQAINVMRMATELAYSEGQIEGHEYSQRMIELEKKEDILRDKSPLRSMHERRKKSIK